MTPSSALRWAAAQTLFGLAADLPNTRMKLVEMFLAEAQRLETPVESDLDVAVSNATKGCYDGYSLVRLLEKYGWTIMRLKAPSEAPTEAPEPPRDEWTREAPLSILQLVEFRRAQTSHGVPEHKDSTWSEKFTCDTCPRASVCLLAFDDLNTDGYCLYEK